MTLEKVRRIAIMLSLGAFALALAGYMWITLGGGDSRGSYEPADFSTLSYTPVVNGYLACDTDACPLATADRDAVTIDASPDAVRTAIARLDDSDPEIKMQRFDFGTDQYDLTLFVRSIRLYQVVVIKLVGDGAQTQLQIYSYQPVGASDKADHRKRALDVISRIRQSLQVIA